MREFWAKNKDKCLTIRSIDAVYEEYLEYLKEKNINDHINRYIFRTYIRKNGYNNSGVEMKIMTKKDRRQIKKERRIHKQIKKNFEKYNVPYDLPNDPTYQNNPDYQNN